VVCCIDLSFSSSNGAGNGAILYDPDSADDIDEDDPDEDLDL
jgi:elongator complex protein 5